MSSVQAVRKLLLPILPMDIQQQMLISTHSGSKNNMNLIHKTVLYFSNAEQKIISGIVIRKDGDLYLLQPLTLPKSEREWVDFSQIELE